MADPNLPTGEVKLGNEQRLGQELRRAAEVGRLVVSTLQERTRNPKYSVPQYTFPMLNASGFSQESVSKVSAPGDNISEETVRQARGASIALAVEAASQIVEARPTSSRIAEDIESLQDMSRMVSRSAGLGVQLADREPRLVVEAGRGALEKRKDAVGLEDAATWDDKRVIEWTVEMFGKANSRLAKKIDAIEAYNMG